ncbi:MAG: hypothetical protein QW763_01225 [Archaeoglobaceae archaeon]
MRRHLVCVDYKDEAERKRIEYTIEKWKESSGIEKLKGIAFFVERNLYGLLNELMSKMNPESIEKLRVYSLIEEKTPEVEIKTVSFEIRSMESPEITKKLLEIVMAKNNARILPGTDRYFSLTRKGRVEIEISENGDKLSFRITGNAEAVERFSERLKKDLEFFLGGGNV